jgi:hypothetical protein
MNIRSLTEEKNGPFPRSRISQVVLFFYPSRDKYLAIYVRSGVNVSIHPAISLTLLWASYTAGPDPARAGYATLHPLAVWYRGSDLESGVRTPYDP